MDGQTTRVERQRIRKHHACNCEIRQHMGTGCYVDEQVNLSSWFLDMQVKANLHSVKEFVFVRSITFIRFTRFTTAVPTTSKTLMA